MPLHFDSDKLKQNIKINNNTGHSDDKTLILSIKSKLSLA